MSAVPALSTTVLDCPDPLALARFYARLLDWPEPEPTEGNAWVTLVGGSGRLDFQRVDDFRPPTWPVGERPQMLHLDLVVADLDAAHERAVAIGARPLELTRPTFRVYADPAGHPFCLCAC